ncbi:hypothetical protein SUGI_0833600 [Cryptomeria japonica]|uniref:KIN14B-interacting protein At4g14310 n=1 Tax=Cryptomeria japonica TaxID=3369 RepID=UPI0024146E40|nr:KIN14B-interacting protein At4g14310 [Cryptomeria japonica]GLJ40458.1 hypothetical protein SUGI_0833600 [Cryptomeria japonica]
MSTGVGKKEKRRPSRADASLPPPPNQEMGSEHKYKRRDREKEKENPPLHTARNGVIEGRGGRGLSTRNNNSSASKHNSSTMPLKHTVRSGVRNAGRSEEPRQVAKEKEEAQSLSLRWSTSSLPSSTNNNNGKSSSSVACIISDLQRQRQQRERERECRSRPVLQNSMGAEEEDERMMIPSSPKPPPAPSTTDQTKKKNQVKDEEENVKGSEEVRVEGNNSFPSKIHERLASLEKRVSQISSELRRTKEMLDANNTHKSMTMLSDIHLKISCIEKAMTADSFIGEDSEEDGSLIHMPTKSDDPANRSPGSHKKEDDLQESSPSLKKRLSHQELEDRLFPHQKLLRSRSSIQLTVLKPKSENLCKNSSDSHAQDISEKELLSPIDEDPIAAEFLTALNHKYNVLSGDNTDNLMSSKSDEMNQGPALPISDRNENDHSRIVSRHGYSVEGIDTDCNEHILACDLACDETMEFNDKENDQPCACNAEEIEETSLDRLTQLGHKTSTAGWFVSEGESILLAHDDGSCSFHDIVNSEEKAEYKVPHRQTPNSWGDCWLIRAAGSDGRSCKYVVAASTGSTLNNGFCSWDFYNKEIVAYHTEAELFTCPSSTFSSISTQTSVLRTNSCLTNLVPENQHWWYRPCGPLLVATASSQKTVIVYDIRDGDHVMKWDTQRNVTNMNHSSPLQWRNKGKVVVAETESISLWDVSSLEPRSLHRVVFPGRKVSALHVHNTDSECTGGVRQRVSSAESEGNDGLFCTQDAINVFDFRVPSGVGLKIPTFGENVQSIFAQGDLIFAGVVTPRFSSKMAVQCRVNQWSIRGGKPACVYTLPESNVRFEESSVPQVWGSANLVMAINGGGLSIFDSRREDNVQSRENDHLRTKAMREIIGPDDLKCSSFDYAGSSILLISKDCPAFWRYLS